MTGHVVVLGAGVVGLACGLSLQRAGFEVTLVDRGAPGEGASLGNAGHMATASIIPQSVPGILKQTLRMLRDPKGPLIARPGYVASNLPWFLRFLSYGTQGRMEAGAIAMAAMMARVHESWAPLLEDAEAKKLVTISGALHVYRSHAALRAAEAAYDLRRRLGVDSEKLDIAEAREREPALSPDLAGAVWIPSMGYVHDPLLLSRHLAARIKARGGRLLRTEATGIDGRGVLTTSGRIDADLIVLAAGAWSRRFAGQLGLRVPLVAERGYHLMLDRDASPLRTPLLLVERRMAVTPMQDGIRLASIAEFANPDARPDHDRAASVFAGLGEWAEGLGAPPIRRWVGPRPVTPDSRPVIGRAPKAGHVLLAFGHGHLGLTLAALTGEVVTDLALGREPGIDMNAVSPTRFGG